MKEFTEENAATIDAAATLINAAVDYRKAQEAWDGIVGKPIAAQLVEGRKRILNTARERLLSAAMVL